MRRVSIPILGWVIVGLALVGGLPFVVTGLQIERSRNALVDETQQTQRMVARSVADELQRHLEVVAALVRATANDPAVWENPASTAAGEALGRLFEMHEEIVSVGSFVSADQGPTAVVQLRRGSQELLPAEVLGPPDDTEPRLVTVEGIQRLRLQRPTPRPGLFIAALAQPPSLDRILAKPGISAARIVLAGPGGEVLDGDPGVLEELPAERREETLGPAVPVGSHSEYRAEVPTVWGFAAVPGSDWRVVTVQPAAMAEQASAEMQAAARTGFAITLAVVIALSLGAWLTVVRPIRRLVRAQQRLAGAGDGEAAGGGEIRQLEASFRRLETALNERDRLSEVFLDRYQVLSTLGSGAMGMVYQGRDPKLDRKVALKTILIGGELAPEERSQLAARLLQEGLTAAKLTHPNIVTVYDVLGDDEHAFIAMEYVQGESVEHEIERAGPLSPARVGHIAEGVLRALVAAHREDVIHRDIKPANILVTTDDTVKLSDFGIASYRRQVARGDEGLVLGTPGYLAPECYRDRAFDARTDLFALGVTLVECLTSAPPFGGRNLQQIITRTASRDVVLPGETVRRMPAAMPEWLLRLLAKNPDKRTPSARQALDELLEFKADLVADASHPPPIADSKRQGEPTHDQVEDQPTAAVDVDRALDSTRVVDD